MQIKKNITKPFAIDGDKVLFDKIVADMRANSGNLKPAAVWDLGQGGHEGGKVFENKLKNVDVSNKEYSDDVYEQKYSTMEKMLDPWIGCTGLQTISEAVFNDYYRYLKEIDHLNIFPEYFNDNKSFKDNANNLIITDLGSMMDINLINIYLEQPVKKISVMEVGGGYGRLAEVFLNVFPGKINYVLVDAVPASIMYSYLYMKKHYPELKIGFYYNGDVFNPKNYDCYIMPAWHFEKQNEVKYDLAVNIFSMQEMDQHHVDYYMNLFNEIVNNDGLIYLSNEKDYIFRGKWNYPDNWELLSKHRTPRSYTLNSPTETYRKRTYSCLEKNNPINQGYLARLDNLIKSTHIEARLADLERNYYHNAKKK